MTFKIVMLCFVKLLSSPHYFLSQWRSKHRPSDSASQLVKWDCSKFLYRAHTFEFCLKIDNAFCSTVRVEVADMHCLPRLLQSSIRQTPFLASHLSTSSALQAKVLGSATCFSFSALACMFCWSMCCSEWSSLPRPAAWLLALVLTPTSFRGNDTFSILKHNNAQDCCCPLWRWSLWWLWNPRNCCCYGSSDQGRRRGSSVFNEITKLNIVWFCREKRA